MPRAPSAAGSSTGGSVSGKVWASLRFAFLLAAVRQGQYRVVWYGQGLYMGVQHGNWRYRC